jgi:hypothetical protein
MQSYHIQPDGDGFQVVERIPNGHQRRLVQTKTEAEARVWLLDHGLKEGNPDLPPD